MKKTLFYILFLVAGVVNAQTATEKKVTWDYPVKPEMEEWKFQTMEEMINACQIPDVILSSLSTEELTDLCLNYPLLMEIYRFNDFNEGLDNLYRTFNGIRILSQRRDASSNLTKQYMEKIKSVSLLNEEISDIEKGRLLYFISNVEVLLARIGQDNDEKESCKNILQVLVVGYKEKLNYTDYFAGTGFRTNLYSRATVLSKMDTSWVERLPQRENNPALFTGRVNEQTVRIIDELSYRLIE